jgi:hypothetical protein
MNVNLGPNPGASEADKIVLGTLLSPTAINNLRESQRVVIDAASRDAIGRLSNDQLSIDGGLSSSTAAKNEASNDLNSSIAAHVEMTLDRSSPFFGRAQEMVRKYSYMNMSDEDWSMGPENADGTRDAANSGMNMLRREISQLLGGSLTDPDPTNPGSPDDNPDTLLDAAV